MEVAVTIPPQLSNRERVEVARKLLRGVVAANRMLIRKGLIPPLYRANVLYKREPKGTESFVDASIVNERGHGDCAHLAAWRVAELQEALRNAIITGKVPRGARMPQLRLYMRPKHKTVHVQIRHSDGRIEDPSRFLGMVPAGE